MSALGWWSVAAACFGTALALGMFVAARTPRGLDVAAAALRGRGVTLARLFTRLGRWYALVAILVVAYAVATALGRSPQALLAVAVLQSLSQSVNLWLKHRFGRLRPDRWLVWKEPDTSYPSGHAMTAMTFYFPLALAAWSAPLPPEGRIGLTALAAACVAGLPWSRLALGAHYLSDVAGGLLFGGGWLCLLLGLTAQAAH